MRSFALALLFLSSGPAAAQELRGPEARQGYYIGLGFRTGVTEADNEDIGSLGTLSHFGALARFGQMTFPWLGFGIAIGGGQDANEEWSIGYGNLLLEAQVKPFDIDLAFRLAAGVGGGSASRADSANEQEDDPEFLFGSMYVLGVSYDWFPFYDPKSYGSGSTAITFFVESRFFPGGDVESGSAFLGVEVTFWTGLDKRKLDLPPDKAFR